MKTKVLIKETKKFVDVKISPHTSMEVKDATLKRWQDAINYLTEMMDVSVGLVMMMTETNIKELVKSTFRRYPNRIYESNLLKQGLYCETVVGNDDRLYIKHINESAWNDCPSITFDAVSYLGYPIHYPNGDIFGTVCILDKKEIVTSQTNLDLMLMTRDCFEKDLCLITMEKEITSLSVIDPLTGLYNSNKINEIVEEYQYEISRKVSILAIAYIRINNFKQIIEEYGYDESEDVISLFAKIIKTRSRFIDRIGILDNNGFIILSKGSTEEGQNVLIRDLKKYAETHLQLEEYNLQFAFGNVEVSEDESIRDKMLIAEQRMIENIRELYGE